MYYIIERKKIGFRLGHFSLFFSPSPSLSLNHQSVIDPIFENENLDSMKCNGIEICPNREKNMREIRERTMQIGINLF